jgi:DNA-directed RNA polymerase specialized sigma24 family protein
MIDLVDRRSTASGARRALSLSQRVERHIVDLRRYAHALVGSSTEADELVQECLVRALARQYFWTRIRDLRAYLFSIMHNAYVDRLATQRRQGISVEIDEALPRLSEPAAQVSSIELRDVAVLLALAEMA